MSTKNSNPSTQTWHSSPSSGGQAIVSCEQTGKNIAVCYDKENGPLLAAAPTLLRESKALIEKLRNMAFRSSHYCELEQVIFDLENQN